MRGRLRERARRSASEPVDAAPPWALLSFMLRYPNADVVLSGAVLRAEVQALPPGPVRDSLAAFMESWDAGDAGAMAARYVETFDLRRRASLELTYYAYGDTRERGMALLRLKKLYRAGGLPTITSELPDHLTVMLAFAALAPEGHGAALLAQHRPAIELVRLSLDDLESPYSHVLDALARCLPPLGESGRAEVERLAREGPPEEAVGLEPYGPPEAMPQGARA